MKKISGKVTEHCFGCNNCIEKCPVHAIEMKESELGTLYAFADAIKCIGCGKCQNICPSVSFDNSQKSKEAYAALSTEEYAKDSASGGIFFVLAKMILEMNGCVVGAAYDFDWNVKHIIVEEKEDLRKLQGSKYVKSSTVHIFPEVEKLLSENRWVLFSGTPCQVAALGKFLSNKVNKEKLLTVDIICHGTPSNKLFKEMITSLEQKDKSNITEFQFRSKKYGHKLIGSYRTNRKHNLYSSENWYYNYFLEGVTYNEACYSCPFANENRTGDITLGDFWGVTTELPDFFKDNLINESASVSAVLINSEKGKVMFDRLKSSLVCKQTEAEKIIRNNPQLQHPIKIDLSKRNQLCIAYNQNGYEGIIREFKNEVTWKKYELRVLSWIPPELKIKIKHLVKRVRKFK